MPKWLLRLLCVLLGACACVTLTRAASAVELQEAESQVFLQPDGSIDVAYTLKISDTEGRGEIKKIGQFYEPIEFAKTYVRDASATNPVTMRPLGDGYYQAAFAHQQPAGRYALVLEYHVAKTVH